MPNPMVPTAEKDEIAGFVAPAIFKWLSMVGFEKPSFRASRAIGKCGRTSPLVLLLHGVSDPGREFGSA